MGGTEIKVFDKKKILYIYMVQNAPKIITEKILQIIWFLT